MWVARDEDGTLWLYEKKPHKAGLIWRCDNYYDGHMSFDDARFNHVKWGDDKPTEVTLIEKDHVDSEG